ncbi:hypothetical protein BESB_079250 [Besnoitia besnoiti]|uniref:SRS domain-containing protein n=1 Tax=Besnoitia besnoiti TaxID=94643 RepID=A0A2A9M6X9_BESBE|nr:hypothetical protein BESB_079250 [Besnoitia besnoiti]PFH33709.1 hypothetical protein BESB_079250 [Besnoitia besnoiti]
MMLSAFFFALTLHLWPALFVLGAGNSNTCSEVNTAIAVTVDPQTKGTTFMCGKAVSHIWPAGDTEVATYFGGDDLKAPVKLAETFGEGSRLSVQKSEEGRDSGSPVTATLKLERLPETQQSIYFACGAKDYAAGQASGRRLTADDEATEETEANRALRGKEPFRKDEVNKREESALRGEHASSSPAAVPVAGSPPGPHSVPIAAEGSLGHTGDLGGKAGNQSLREGGVVIGEDSALGKPDIQGTDEEKRKDATEHNSEQTQPLMGPLVPQPPPPHEANPGDSVPGKRTVNLKNTTCLVAVTVPAEASASTCTASKKNMELDINSQTMDVNFQCGSTVPSLSPANTAETVYDESCKKEVSLGKVLPSAKLEHVDSGYKFSVERLPPTLTTLCYKCSPKSPNTVKEVEVPECTVKINVVGGESSTAAGGSLRLATFFVCLSIAGMLYLF